MPDLDQRLRGYGEVLEEAVESVTFDELDGHVAAPPYLRRWWQHPATATLAGAALIGLVFGGFGLLAGGEDATTQTTTPTNTTLPVATTLEEITETSVVRATEVEMSAALTALVDSGRYRVRSVTEEMALEGSIETHLDPIDVLVIRREQWDGWNRYPRIESLLVALAHAPETRLAAQTQVFLARFEDELTADGFLTDYFDLDEAREEVFVDPSQSTIANPTDVPDLFEVTIDADDALGFMWDDSPIVGVRQGTSVAIAGIWREPQSPEPEEPLLSTSDYANEVKYLAAWLAAALVGEEPSVDAPVTEPFTDEESRGISLIHDYHAALNAGDYDKLIEIHWPSQEIPGHDGAPTVREELVYATEPLLEAGAVFEVSGCRPTESNRELFWEGGLSRYVLDDDNWIRGLLEIECYSGYQTESEGEFGYHEFLYRDGHLLILGVAYGEDWSP